MKKFLIFITILLPLFSYSQLTINSTASAEIVSDVCLASIDSTNTVKCIILEM